MTVTALTAEQIINKKRSMEDLKNIQVQEVNEPLLVIRTLLYTHLLTRIANLGTKDI